MRKAMAFPVRFVAEGESVQTTSKDLDEQSVFVRCVEPPAPGDRVVLRLYLPGMERADSIQSVVRERVTEGRESGFLAGFVDLTPEALQHIRAALERGTADALAHPEARARAGENRRLLPRYLDRFRVTLTAGDQSRERASINLSASGVFIGTDEPPELDAIVQVVLELPDGQPPAEVQGIVVRRVASGEGEPAGAGVQFIGADDAFRARLDAHLDRLKQR